MKMRKSMGKEMRTRVKKLMTLMKKVTEIKTEKNLNSSKIKRTVMTMKKLERREKRTWKKREEQKQLDVGTSQRKQR